MDRGGTEDHTTRGCPGEEELIAFCAGHADGASRAAMLAHVDGCEACRVLVGDLAAPSSSRLPVPGNVDPRTLADGERLLDRYVVQRFIARGGMGEVYEAKDELLGEIVALKTLTCTALDQTTGLARMKAEVLMARRVTHPNVCRILEFGVHEQPGHAERIPFLTMEFLRGETLRARLARTGPMSPGEARAVLEQLIAALAAIHEAGVVHRDLKTENIFLREGDGPMPRLVVMDFGLARSSDPAGQSRSSRGLGVAGTVDYMAPEQVRGERATLASDIYALGVVLFELLTGTLPFAASTSLEAAARRLVEPPPPLRSRLPDAPVAWEQLIARCLAREPERRFTSVTELLASVPPRPTPRSKAWPSRPALLLAIGLAALCATLVAELGGTRAARTTALPASNGPSELHEKSAPSTSSAPSGSPSPSVTAAVQATPAVSEATQAFAPAVPHPRPREEEEERAAPPRRRTRENRAARDLSIEATPPAPPPAAPAPPPVAPAPRPTTPAGLLDPWNR